MSANPKKRGRPRKDRTNSGSEPKHAMNGHSNGHHQPARPHTEPNLKPNETLPAGNGANSNVRPKDPPPPADIPSVCVALQQLQRQRAITIKSRMMQANRLQAVVAGTLGYKPQLEDKERKKLFGAAGKLVKDVQKGKADHPMREIILATGIGISSFKRVQTDLEKEMLRLVKALPVLAWVRQREQSGFGPLSLAVVVGECGDLFSYANPAKVWRRLGCAPWEFDGKNLMGATWKSGREGKLPAEEWERFGYSPRRRSIAYLIGENLTRSNYLAGMGDTEKEFEVLEEADDALTDLENASEGGGEQADTERSRAAGPYRQRYLDGRRVFRERHPDYTDLRTHRHGMLVATKLLLKNLWIEWRKQPRPEGGSPNPPQMPS